MRRPSLLFTLLLLTLSAQGQAPLSPKVVERYKQMLAANPAEGTAMDRLWKAYAESGQTGQLLEQYKAEGTFASQMIYGHLLRRAGREEEAATAFGRAAALDAKSPLPALATAQVESARNHPREAAGAYEQAIGLIPSGDPRLSDTLLQLGAAWLDAGDIQKAAEAWEKTVALNPNDLTLRQRLAETYVRNFLPDKAIEHLTYIESHAPATDRPLALQQIARIQQGAGRPDPAIAALEKALSLTGPGNWLREELESQIIRLHQRYHRTEELAARWKKQAEESPRDLGACLQLVELYERLGQLEDQRIWLTKLTTLAPKNAEYRQRLARLLMQMETPEAARQVYDVLLKEQPTNADFVFERARVDLQFDDIPAARQRIAALLTARKNDETVRARALAFYEQNRLNDLVEEHLKADAASGGEEGLTALANFYFIQRREEDAHKTLERLIRADDPPERKAAAYMRVAQLLRAQNDIEPAVNSLRMAVEIQPDSRETHLGLGELLAARGDYPGAQFEFEKAVKLSKTENDRVDADQKLFESYRAQSATSVAQRSRPWMSFTPPGGEPNPPEPNPELDKFMLALEREAIDQLTEETWLRVGRWQLWNRNQKAAVLATRRALTLNPKSIPAHELMVKIESTLGQPPGAVQSLLNLAAIDPANRASYERRAGQFELQAGHIPEALALFERLAADNPGNADALTDLALTQQRAERWSDALATWRQVYAASPVSRKKEALTPLRRALEHLNLFEESASLQLKALEREPGDRERLTAFNELLTFCSQKELLGWLRTEFEKRRKLRADDYFTEVALGRILKASGDAAGAFEVLADASYAAPNQAEALPELIREAEELHKLDAAVKLQAQLLRIAPQDSPDGLEKLAQLQEKNFEIDEAARTWERAVTHYPRDAAALNHAVDFQLAWGTPDQALALLRKARTLEPADLRTLSNLATLAVESGGTAEAEECLEEILRLTAAEKPGDPIRFPALKPTEAGRLQTAYLATVGQRHGKPTPEAMRALRSFWVDDAQESTLPTTKGDREVRLASIRQLAQIQGAKGAPARDAWVARWQKNDSAPSESLWALYYAGAGLPTLERMEQIMRSSGRDQKAPQAFIWLALQTGQYERLGSWLREKSRTPVERDFLFVALGQALDSNTVSVNATLTNSLFTEGTHLRVWQAAMLFADRNRFREAIALGRRVFDQSSTQRAAYGQIIAHWYLQSGDAKSAREILRTTIASTAESLDAPVCGALREYYLLLPENERANFVETYLQNPETQKQPLHVALATVLLRGLAGQETEAKAALDRLLAMRAMAGTEVGEPGTSGTRHLRFILETGAQLQTLKMESLAIHFWESALADAALVELQSDQASMLARDIRQRLYTLRAAIAPPGGMPVWIEAYSRISLNDGLAPLAGSLAALGAHARAIALFRQIWERSPDDADSMRNLYNACRNAGDMETTESALRECLRDGGIGLHDGARREFVLNLAEVLEHKGDLDGAKETLTDAMQIAPNDTRVLLRLGQLQARGGNTEAAIAAYQRLLVFEPGNTSARFALSAAYEAQGRLPEALSQLKGNPSPDLSTALAVLQLKTGQPEAAQAVVERLTPPQHIAPALALASAFAGQGDTKRARAVIHAALLRTDPRLSFPLQCKLIELLTPDDGIDAARREMRRLRRFAGLGENTNSLLASYLDFAAQQTGRLKLEKEFASEVRALWAEGEGPIAAGAAILTSQIDTADPAAFKPVLDQLLKRQDLTDPALQNVSETLEKAGHMDLVVRVQQRIAEINPINEKNLLNLARSLHRMGRTEEARARLEELTQRSVINEDNLGAIAEVYGEIGDSPRAAQLYAQAARGDRFARNWTTLLPYARLQSQQGDLAGAKETLRVAFTHPANRNFTEIISWIVAAGRLAQADTEATDFQLTLPRVAALRRALFNYFEKAGQPGNALSLAEDHPEIVDPNLAVSLRQAGANGRAFERAAKLLERYAAQADSPDAYSLELARLHGDWAKSEADMGRTSVALGHLRQAHEKHPELFEIALPLSTMLASQGDRKGAMETLESFLALGKNPAEVEQARAKLTKLRAGGS